MSKPHELRPESIPIGTVAHNESVYPTPPSKEDDYHNFVTPSPLIEVKISGRTLYAILDTGAESSILPLSVYRELFETEIPVIQLGRFLQVIGANGLEIPIHCCLREVHLEICKSKRIFW